MELARHHPDVERWRPFVHLFRDLLCPETDTDVWLQVMWGESQGQRRAVNPSSQASGLYQHLPQYFESRRRQTIDVLKKVGYQRKWMSEDRPIFHPKTNISIAMWLWTKQGWGAWSATTRFPPEAYGPEVFWVLEEAGYCRIEPSRTQAP